MARMARMARIFICQWLNNFHSTQSQNTPKSCHSAIEVAIGAIEVAIEMHYQSHQHHQNTNNPTKTLTTPPIPMATLPPQWQLFTPQFKSCH